MKRDTNEGWTRPHRLDTLLNGGVIGTCIVGVMLAVLQAPAPANVDPASGPAQAQQSHLS